MSKDFYNEVYQVDHSSQYGGGEDGMPQRSALLINDTSAWLERTGLALRHDAKILEIGCGMAFVAKVHPGWHGAEYSKTAVARVKERDGLCGIDSGDTGLPNRQPRRSHFSQRLDQCGVIRANPGNPRSIQLQPISPRDPSGPRSQESEYMCGIVGVGNTAAIP